MHYKIQSIFVNRACDLNMLCILNLPRNKVSLCRYANKKCQILLEQFISQYIMAVYTIKSKYK